MNTIDARILEQIPHNVKSIFKLCRAEDGYINATAICSAYGKLYKHWRAEAGPFLELLAKRIGMHIDAKVSPSASSNAKFLIKYIDNGKNDRATWVHPRIAFHILRWISPEFDLKANEWFFESYVFGTVSIGSERDVMVVERMHSNIILASKKELRSDDYRDYLSTIILFKVETDHYYVLACLESLRDQMVESISAELSKPIREVKSWTDLSNDNKIMDELATRYAKTYDVTMNNNHIVLGECAEESDIISDIDDFAKEYLRDLSRW